MSPVRGIISWTARVTGATRRLKEAFSLPPGPVYLEQFRVGARGWAGSHQSSKATPRWAPIALRVSWTFSCSGTPSFWCFS